MAAASVVAVVLALAVAHVVSSATSSPFSLVKAARRHASADDRRWYSPNSIWNTPIGTHPRLAANNASLIAAMAQTGVIGVSYNDTPAIWYVSPSTPKVPVRIDVPRCNARTVWVPIPRGAIPDSSPEGRMVLAQSGTGVEFDLYRAQSPNRPPKSSADYSTPCPTVNEWTAADVVTTNWETASGELPGGTWGSGTADGAGAILPRDTQMAPGATWDHALGAAYRNTCSAAMSWCPTVAPATREDGTCTDESHCLPEGARLQLDPSVNCSTWPLLTYVWQRQMCRTLQRYGVIIVDTNDAGPTIANQWWGSLRGYVWPWLRYGQLDLPRAVLSHFRVLAWQ
jgi:hypothetical protein